MSYLMKDEKALVNMDVYWSSFRSVSFLQQVTFTMCHTELCVYKINPDYRNNGFLSHREGKGVSCDSLSGSLPY
jgi:hypothetical protein